MPDDVYPSTVSADLEFLLHRAADGDEHAFANLYDATAPRVFGLVLGVLRDWAQAEEVAHETYLEIWRQAERFDDQQGTAIAWMIAISHRHAVTRVSPARCSPMHGEVPHPHWPASTTRADVTR